jgi:predicted nucleic acid-binding protein
LAPAHWKAELANVVWKATVFFGLDAGRIPDLLTAVEALPVTSVGVEELWRGGIARGVAHKQSAYDTLFVELAAREGIPMASYDAGLRRKFPAAVFTPAVLLRRMTAGGH